MFRCLPNSSKDASRRQSTRLLAEVGNREWGTGNMIGSYRTFARDSMSVCSQQRMKLYHSLLPTSYSPLPTPDFQDRFIEEEAETGTKSNDASFLSTQHSALSTQHSGSDRFSNGLSRCGCEENAIAIVSCG